MIIQFCGLSGVGKTTLASMVKKKLIDYGARVEILDGDEYRKTLCKDLGFSKKDRIENIRRLGFVAGKLSEHGVIPIISAINPFEEARRELKREYKNVKTIYLDCPLEILIARDTKGLYKRANLPAGHPEKVCNLTGVDGRFDIPKKPDLYINTYAKDIKKSAEDIFHYIINNQSFPSTLAAAVAQRLILSTNHQKSNFKSCIQNNDE